MRRLELPKLLYLDPYDQRRLGAGARDIMAAAWHRAFARSPKRRRLIFPKADQA
jgi:hypothetical protein